MSRVPTAATLFVAALLASVVANVVLTTRMLGDREAAPVGSVATGAPLVMRTEGGRLEVARIEAQEQFQTQQDHTILGVPVGSTVTRIRVPAHYRYQIELARTWRLHERDDAVLVIAPRIEPALPVAIDTGRMEKEVSGLWSPFTGSAQLDRLERSITRTLDAKASSAAYLELQREAARATVRKFAAKWMQAHAQVAARGKPLRVHFADEPVATLGDAPPPAPLY